MCTHICMYIQRVPLKPPMEPMWAPHCANNCPMLHIFTTPFLQPSVLGCPHSPAVHSDPITHQSVLTCTGRLFGTLQPGLSPQEPNCETCGTRTQTNTCVLTKDTDKYMCTYQRQKQVHVYLPRTQTGTCVPNKATDRYICTYTRKEGTCVPAKVNGPEHETLDRYTCTPNRVHVYLPPGQTGTHVPTTEINKCTCTYHRDRHVHMYLPQRQTSTYAPATDEYHATHALGILDAALTPPTMTTRSVPTGCHRRSLLVFLNSPKKSWRCLCIHVYIHLNSWIVLSV